MKQLLLLLISSTVFISHIWKQRIIVDSNKGNEVETEAIYQDFYKTLLAFEKE